MSIMNFTSLAAAAALGVAGLNAANAAPATQATAFQSISALEAPAAFIERVAAKKPVRHARAGSLKAKRPVVRDTCPGNDASCIKTLTASCDKAGGGLSTQPDGSVDCYVVGIHDTP